MDLRDGWGEEGKKYTKGLETGGGLQIVGILMDATINSWRGNPLKVEIIL